MRNALLLVGLLASLFASAADSTRVLFIGNSITYFNNMPQVFRDIALSKGDTVALTMYAPGGTGFVHHVNDANVYNHFRKGNWDYIVLQPGSNESPGLTVPIHESLTRARRMLDSIYRYSPCAQVLYYEISYGVWGSTAANLVTYNQTMDRIRINLEYLADSTRLFFAPVGEAFRTRWNRDQSRLLWGAPGDIYPNREGSYLASCVFYASIFQKPSAGTTVYNGVAAAEARKFQQLADSVVLRHLPNWRMNTYNLKTRFGYRTNKDSLILTDSTSNADSLRWEFGDGGTSKDLNALHVYKMPGLYKVKLRAYQNGCMQVVEKEVDIRFPVVINSLDKWRGQQLRIYPQPAGDYLYIENLPANAAITVRDLRGKLLLRSNEAALHVPFLPAGVYLLNVISEKGQINHRWIKE